VPLPALTVLIVLPLALAAVAFAVPRSGCGPSCCRSALSPIRPDPRRGRRDRRPGPAAGTAWLAVDPLGGLALLVVSGLFTICALYARATCCCASTGTTASSSPVSSSSWGWRRPSPWRAPGPPLGDDRADDARHGAAPLLQPQCALAGGGLEVLVIGSVGIALALLGSFFVAYAAHLSRSDESLFFTSLNAAPVPPASPAPGCGPASSSSSSATDEDGLAPPPLKPDAYGEAPGIVGALLPADDDLRLPRSSPRLRRARRRGEGAFARQLLVFLGLSPWVRRRLHGPPGRPQADARLFERRAHGHPRLRHRLGGAGIFGASSTRSTTRSPRP